MAVCDQCGNDYDRAFTVEYQGARHTFDSFECAMTKLAPTCETCGCRIVGHGVQAGGDIYCCAHCAKRAGEQGLSDRA